MGVLKTVGSAVGSFLKEGAKDVFEVGKAGMKSLGSAEIYLGKKTIQGAQIFGKDIIDGNARNPIVHAVKQGARIGNSMVKVKPYSTKLDPKTGEMILDGGVNVTPLGIGIMGSAMAVSGLMDTSAKMDQERMGVVDPDRKSATPSFETPEYSMTGRTGASGDLVFALNSTRQGGFL